MARAAIDNSERVEANRSPEYRNRRGGNRGRGGRTGQRRLAAAIRRALPLVEAIHAAEDNLKAATTERMKKSHWDELRRAEAALRDSGDFSYIRYHADLESPDPKLRGVLTRLVEWEFRGHTSSIADGREVRVSPRWKSDRSKVVRYATSYIDEAGVVRKGSAS